jgi:hypothetical protein
MVHSLTPFAIYQSLTDEVQTHPLPPLRQHPRRFDNPFIRAFNPVALAMVTQALWIRRRCQPHMQERP